MSRLVPQTLSLVLQTPRGRARMNHLYTIEQLFAERLFRIPDYRRGYAWGEQQLDVFVEDVELLPEQKRSLHRDDRHEPGGT